MADAAGKTQLSPDQNPPRTRKLFSSFISKPVMATLFLVLVPVLTYHPPEFIVGQFVPARSWEIIHILLVGIAVSYGLFSKRNAVVETEDKEREKNENAGKFENAQSYVNRFLQLSSLFDDESDGGGSGSGSSSPCRSDVGRNRSMAWNSQYLLNEPMLIVDEDRNVDDGSAARISDKPLVLPLRSLRSRVLDEPTDNSVVSGVPPASLSRSDSTKSRSCDACEPDLLAVWGVPDESGASTGNGRVSEAWYSKSVANVKDSVVLSSPIPWRWRSVGMMDDDAREVVDSVDTFQIEELGQSRRQVSLSSSMALSTPSPDRLSPSSSLSSVSPESEIITDSVKKKSFSHKSPHIPTPPPPPPPPAATFRFPVEKTQRVPPPVTNGNRMIVESEDEETENDNDHDSGEDEMAEVVSHGVSNGSPDVDEKADEFIAKFREQIRLQRIESIKRSSAVINNSTATVTATR